MEFFVVQGGRRLRGTIRVAGAKNAVLVELASLLLIPAVSVVRNVPDLSDVHAMIDVLGYLGCLCNWDRQAGVVTVDTRSAVSAPIPVDLLQSFRASILIVGPLLARFGFALVSYPGGCPIGSRPIDFHLRAFERMGASVNNEADFLRIDASGGLVGTDIVLEYPSVGATENILMAALGAHGKTVIHNAAIEPEILDLIALLTRAGAEINCQAPATITVLGGAVLQQVQHDVLPDRLEAGTYLAAAAATGGDIVIPNISPSLLSVYIEKLREMGHRVVCDMYQDGIHLVAGESQSRAVSFTTMPYPGFPTDLQAPMTSLQIFAKGESRVHETVFEKRLSHLHELAKLGVVSLLNGDRAVIKCTGEHLCGAELVGTDIRGAAGLVIAALGIKDKSVVSGVSHIRRGYVAFEEKLRSLGADIVLV